MPLRRPLAVVSAAAALLGASVLVSPASAADEFSVEGAAVIDPATTSYAVSGAGCTGQDATVGVALLPPGSQDVSNAVTVTPSGDGSWSTTLDIASLIRASGGNADQDGWSVSAACMTYDGVSDSKTYNVIFDGTAVDGTFTIEGAAGAQTFTIQATGFSPSENVDVYLATLEDSTTRVADLGTLQAGADGSVSGTLPAPSDVADGTYRLILLGSRYGEFAASTKLIQVSGGTYSTASDNDPGEDPNAQDPGAGTDLAPAEPPAAEEQTSATVSVTAGSSNAAAKADQKNRSNLARTGTNGLLIGGIAAALALIGGGILVYRRRKA